MGEDRGAQSGQESANEEITAGGTFFLDVLWKPEERLRGMPSPARNEPGTRLTRAGESEQLNGATDQT